MYGIRNLKYWFQTIWKDRDYDHHYIYEVLRVKLEKQAHATAKADTHTESARDAKRMLLCARLIRIQQEELYRMEYLDYHRESHTFVPAGNYYTVENEILEDNLDEYFAKYPRQYKRAMLGEINYLNLDVTEKTRQLIAMEISLENQERSRALLFKIINSHINEWWH